jgi:hypothetical protein
MCSALIFENYIRKGREPGLHTGKWENNIKIDVEVIEWVAEFLDSQATMNSCRKPPLVGVT